MSIVGTMLFGGVGRKRAFVRARESQVHLDPIEGENSAEMSTALAEVK